MKKLRVIGLDTAIGSLLYPFQEAGHEVVAAHDSRGLAVPENFSLNFPNTKLHQDPEKLLEYKGIDVLMCQPSCGKFSGLSRKDISCYAKGIDIAKYINAIQPKYFFIESKLAYLKEIPEVEGYTYQLEWVGNHYYGNPQRTRNRLWVMGVRSDINWKFVPQEVDTQASLMGAISHLPETDDPKISHIHRYKPFLKNSQTREYHTLDEAFEMLERDGKLTYVAEDGETKARINRVIAKRGPCNTITGGGTWFHPDKRYPLTAREKACIQGFPMEFSFLNMSASKIDSAIGKSMPFQFTRELVRQLGGGTIGERKKVLAAPVELSLFRRVRLDSNGFLKSKI